jgi:hypothetical protein
VKIFRVALYVLLGLFLAIQLARPARSNPPEDATQTLEALLKPPAEVNAVLARACADCHSSRTRWPWYTNIAPVSWWTVNHVEEGRRELSFSTWGTYKPRRQAHKLEEICEQMKAGEMPMASYVRAHGDAKLSAADVTLVCDWAMREHTRLAATLPAASPPPAP